MRGQPGGEIYGIALYRIRTATGGAGVAGEYPALRYTGLQWQPAGPIDGRSIPQSVADRCHHRH